MLLSILLFTVLFNRIVCIVGIVSIVCIVCIVHKYCFKLLFDPLLLLFQVLFNVLFKDIVFILFQSIVGIVLCKTILFWFFVPKPAGRPVPPRADSPVPLRAGPPRSPPCARRPSPRALAAPSPRAPRSRCASPRAPAVPVPRAPTPLANRPSQAALAHGQGPRRASAARTGRHDPRHGPHQLRARAPARPAVAGRPRADTRARSAHGRADCPRPRVGRPIPLCADHPVSP